tara:strand:+ start:349 stop:615 length:267 start_codon:yes stop_codon:yes gene_type:complete
MDYTQIIIGLLSALGGGILGTFFTYRLGNRKQDQNDFEAIIGEYKSLVESYKLEVIQLRSEVDSIKILFIEKEKEIIELQVELEIHRK